MFIQRINDNPSLPSTVVPAKNQSVNFQARYKPDIYQKTTQNIDKTALNLKPILNRILNLFKKSKNIPQTQKAILLYFSGLQTKKEFFEEYYKKVANGEYIDSNITNTANLVKSLDSNSVTKSWEFPDYKVMFNSGTLTEAAYQELRQKIKDAPYYKLSDIQKRDILNALARNNYHSGDISYDLNFKGTSSPIAENIEDVEDTENTDIVEEIVDKCHDILDTILEFLDDLF